MTGMSRIAIAGDPDLLIALHEMLNEVGAETVAAVSPVNASVLKDMTIEKVKIGDLEDLEILAKQEDAEVLICNSHGVETANRLNIPLIRAGFPQYDTLGGYQKTWIGYRGTRQTLFDLANVLLTLEKGEIHPYKSIYAQKAFYEETSHEPYKATSANATQH